MANTPQVMALLRRPKVEEMLGVSRSTLYNWIGLGTFVEPVRLGAKLSAWPANECEAIAAALIAGKTSKELKALVRKLTADRKGAA